MEWNLKSHDLHDENIASFLSFSFFLKKPAREYIISPATMLWSVVEVFLRKLVTIVWMSEERTLLIVVPLSQCVSSQPHTWICPTLR